MSKASQRKESARNLGKQDAARGAGFRWYRHPQLGDYALAYVEQQRKIYSRRKTFWQRLKELFL